MRVPVSWLKEYVKIVRPVTELADLLTMGGLGVEEIRGEGDDAVLVLEVTSNRGDCLSVIGVAREVAALTGESLKHPSWEVEEDAGIPRIQDATCVQIADPDLCPRYAARLISGVKVGSSPAWMQARLEACGIRPINNIVDITNYVLMEVGQPLHAFDFAALRGLKIIVRRARCGETMISIDGIERPLTDEMLVIADAERPVALAGVMGGLETEVTEQTTDILLESAHFDPISIQRTRNKLGMSTEASYRFERWVDPSGPVRAANRAAQLMAEIAGGKVASGVIDEYPKQVTPVKLSVHPEFVNRRLGTDIAPSEMATMLRRLEFVVDGESPICCEIPTFRNDLSQECDLVEEIARLYGYDNIPTTIPSGVSPRAGAGAPKRLEQRARQTMMRCGLQEVCTFSLTRPALLDNARIGDGAQSLQLRNPLTEDYTMLRTSLIPSLLEVLSNNSRVGTQDVHIFELGKVYLPRENEKLPDERPTLGIALMGSNWAGRWGLDKELARSDFFALKGIVGHLLENFGIPSAEYRPVSNGAVSPVVRVFHPGRCAEVLVEDISLGFLGEVHPEVAEAFSLSQRVYLTELQFDQIAAQSCLARRYQSLRRFPIVGRDVAMIVSQAAAAEAVQQTITDAGGELVESVTLFDVYEGKNIEPGQRSLAFSIHFRAPDRTLTDEEVDNCLARIKDALRQKAGATIREG